MQVANGCHLYIISFLHLGSRELYRRCAIWRTSSNISSIAIYLNLPLQPERTYPQCRCFKGGSDSMAASEKMLSCSSVYMPSAPRFECPSQQTDALSAESPIFKWPHILGLHNPQVTNLHNEMPSKVWACISPNRGHFANAGLY